MRVWVKLRVRVLWYEHCVDEGRHPRTLRCWTRSLAQPWKRYVGKVFVCEYACVCIPVVSGSDSNRLPVLCHTANSGDDITDLVGLQLHLVPSPELVSACAGCLVFRCVSTV